MEKVIFLSVKDCAKILHIDHQKVRRYIKTKALKAIQFSHMGDWRVTSKSLEEFINYMSGRKFFQKPKKKEEK